MARKIGSTTSGNGKEKYTLQNAREDLLARASRNFDGAGLSRSDPLGDARAARAVVVALREHGAELSRRGLPAAYGEAALQLATEIEDHLTALPAAAVSARAQSVESAEILADAAAAASAIRSAVLRVTRHDEGRKVARAFGLGQPFSARQPEHVLRALKQILTGLESNEHVRSDLGVLPEDMQNIEDLARDVSALPAARTVSDEQVQLFTAQAALRAFFDLFAAKTSLAMAADPDERSRMLALVPRAEDRRHFRRAESRANA
jgi:hypothetical protein